ncbi:hypothetical protein M0804_001573 [Polistes exclamans]|nr:hypothetical protein M0804_001573 [Polistes exclamans]
MRTTVDDSAQVSHVKPQDETCNKIRWGVDTCHGIAIAIGGSELRCNDLENNNDDSHEESLDNPQSSYYFFSRWALSTLGNLGFKKHKLETKVDTGLLMVNRWLRLLTSFDRLSSC